MSEKLLLLLLLLLGLQAEFTFEKCSGANEVVFDELIVWPDPALPGADLSITALVTTGRKLEAGEDITISIEGFFGENKFLDVATLDLCDFSEQVVCPLEEGTHQLATVIPAPGSISGDYKFKITVEKGSATLGCVEFTVEAREEDCFQQWVEATVTGVASFERSTPLDRFVGSWVQLGPVVLSENVTLPNGFSGNDWGHFSELAGSSDLLSPYPPTEADLSNFVWGLSGVLTEKKFNPVERIYEHTYVGNFMVGSMTTTTRGHTFVELEDAILSGTFEITFTLNGESPDETEIVGTLSPQKNGQQPPGWKWPSMFSRLQALTIKSASEGAITIGGSGDRICPNAVDGSSDDSLSGLEIALAIILTVALLMVILLLLAVLLLYRKRSDDYEPIPTRNVVDENDEDNTLNDNKPDYGSIAIDEILRDYE